MPAEPPGLATPTGLKIAIVGQGTKTIPSPGYAPIEKHIENLVAALRRRGEDVHLLNRVFPPRRLRLLRHALWAHREIRRLKPDIIHCHSNVNARVLRRLGDRPLVFTSHSRQWTYIGRPGWRRNRNLRNDRAGFRAADARILISRNAAAAAQRDPRSRGLDCTVISNGVDTERYAPPTNVSEAKLLVAVGAIDPVKRWHLLARAVQGTGWGLEIVGPIVNPDYAQQILALNPAVVLRGEVAEGELIATLHRATAIAHPSEAEA